MLNHSIPQDFGMIHDYMLNRDPSPVTVDDR